MPSAPLNTAEDCDRAIADLDKAFEAQQTLFRLKVGDALTEAQLADLNFLDEYHRKEEDTAINHFSQGFEAGRVSAAGADTAKLMDERDSARSTAAVANAVSSSRAWHAFRLGAQACREMMARFVEQGGDTITAASIRANWRPTWGNDPGAPTQEAYETAAPSEISCKPEAEAA